MKNYTKKPRTFKQEVKKKLNEKIEEITIGGKNIPNVFVEGPQKPSSPKNEEYSGIQLVDKNLNLIIMLVPMIEFNQKMGDVVKNAERVVDHGANFIERYYKDPPIKVNEDSIIKQLHKVISMIFYEISQDERLRISRLISEKRDIFIDIDDLVEFVLREAGENL